MFSNSWRPSLLPLIDIHAVAQVAVWQHDVRLCDANSLSDGLVARNPLECDWNAEETCTSVFLIVSLFLSRRWSVQMDVRLRYATLALDRSDFFAGDYFLTQSADRLLCPFVIDVQRDLVKIECPVTVGTSFSTSRDVWQDSRPTSTDPCTREQVDLCVRCRRGSISSS